MTALPPVPLTRRSVVGGAGLAGLAVAASTDVTASAAAVSRVDPLDLDFEVRHRQRAVDLVAPRFRLLADSFRERRRYQVVAGPARPRAPPASPVARCDSRARTAAPSTPCCTPAPPPGRRTARCRSTSAGSPATPSATGCRSGSCATPGTTCSPGTTTPTGTVGIDLTLDGEATTLATAEATLDDQVRFAFGLTSTSVVALADSGSGPEPLVKANLAETDLDLRRPAALAAYRHAFGASAGSGTTELDRVEAGYFGQLGLRDPHLVTHADGRPYLREGKAYFTFTNAGLGFFETAHWGVWTLDLRTYELEQVGQPVLPARPAGLRVRRPRRAPRARRGARPLDRRHEHLGRLRERQRRDQPRDGVVAPRRAARRPRAHHRAARPAAGRPALASGGAVGPARGARSGLQ